jgi:hypothetical protein
VAAFDTIYLSFGKYIFEYDKKAHTHALFCFVELTLKNFVKNPLKPAEIF